MAQGVGPALSRAQEPLAVGGAQLPAALAVGWPLAALALELTETEPETCSLLGHGALWRLFLRSIARAAAIVADALLLRVPWA